MHEDESRERGIHRFEAFSDIVIGFSLAQLGASLAMPKHVGDLISEPFWFFAFLWAFALICIMWLFHRRLFAFWFVPTPLAIFLNFTWLAVVVLLVYDTQVAEHFYYDELIWRIYFILYTLAYGLLAIEYALGVRIRGPHVTPEERDGGIRGTKFMTLWTVPFAVCSLFVFVLPFQVAGMLIWPTFCAFWFASWIMGRRMRKARESAKTPA